MFYAAVALFMFVCPAASVVIDLANGTDESTVAVVGMWFVFWAVGVRLLTAGARQVIKPALTSEGILGIPGRSAWQLVRELGFANLSLGLIGVSSLWRDDWRAPAALAGGLFLLLAGLEHVPKKTRSTEENVAMVSDLVIGLMMLGYVVSQW
jgi:hypothetical protein